LAAEYGALLVHDPRSAGEITGYDGTGRPAWITVIAVGYPNGFGGAEMVVVTAAAWMTPADGWRA
jgi:hypothetical protein